MTDYEKVFSDWNSEFEKQWDDFCEKTNNQGGRSLAKLFFGLAWEKAQAVPEWNDYTVKGPRIDGRYQIFISGEQLTAEYKHPFGFACPIDGCAFVQELITHWAVLNADPVIEAQEQSHE
jgi:hypothetical protein